MPLVDAQRVNFEVVVSGLCAVGGGSKPKPTKNVLHYVRQSFGGPAFSGAAFNTAFLTAVQAAWLALTNLSWTLSQVAIRCIDDPTEGETVSLVNVAGTTTGDMLPNYCAAVFSKKTGSRGKSYRGRMYVAGIAEDDNSNNALTAGAKTRADTLATALAATITDANGLAFKPGIFSKRLTPVAVPPLFPVPHVTIVTAVTARKQIGSMVSRKSPVLI